MGLCPHGPEPGGQAVPMGTTPAHEVQKMPRKRVLEALRPEDRASQRRRLGTLRELTVQPATKRRYSLATQAFFTFLKDEDITLPKEKRRLDDLVFVTTWNTCGRREQDKV